MMGAKYRGAVNHDMKAFGGGCDLPSDPLVDSQRPNAKANFNIFHLFGADDPFISGVDPNSPLKDDVRGEVQQDTIDSLYDRGLIRDTPKGSGGGQSAAQWIPGVSNTVVIIGGVAVFMLMREGK